MIGHLPYAESAVDQSVIELVAENVDVPAFAEGYEVWKEDFDKGEAGIFTAPVAQVIGALEQGMNQSR